MRSRTLFSTTLVHNIVRILYTTQMANEHLTPLGPEKKSWLQRPVTRLLGVTMLLTSVSYRHQNETITYFDPISPAVTYMVDGIPGGLPQPELTLEETEPESVGPGTAKITAPDTASFRVMTFNLHQGKLDNGIDPLIQLLKDKKPDAACFQEAPEELIETIYRSTNMHGVFNSTTTRYPGSDLQGNVILVASDKKIAGYDTGRLPSPLRVLADAHSYVSKRSRLDVVEEALWSPRGTVSVEVYGPTGVTRVVNAHTSYKQFTNNLHLNAYAEALTKPDQYGRTPVTIGCGDLNAQPIAVSKSKLGDVVAGYQLNEPRTFPAPADGSTEIKNGRTIDYLLSPHCNRSDIESIAFGSDHLGLAGTFAIASCSTTPNPAQDIAPIVRGQMNDNHERFVAPLRPLGGIHPRIVRPLKVIPDDYRQVGSPR